MDREPAAIISGIVAVIGALFAALAAFGVAVTDDQQAALKNVVVVAGPFVVLGVGWLIRGRVVSPAATGEAVARAKELPPLTGMNNERVPDVQVPHYRESVAAHLNVDERDLTFTKPPVPAQ